MLDLIQNFEKTGHLKLANTTLTVNQLRYLQRYIKNNPQPIAENVAYYQFHLSNVKLIPNATQDQVLAGSITEHTIGHKHDWADLQIVQWGTNQHESITLQPTARENDLTQQQSLLEETLLNLLSQKNAWSAIKLNQVVFSCEERHSNLSQDF